MVTVINTPPQNDRVERTERIEQSDGSVGWAVAVIVLLALIVFGVYLWYQNDASPRTDSGNNDGTTINVTLPPTTAPEAPVVE